MATKRTAQSDATTAAPSHKRLKTLHSTRRPNQGKYSFKKAHAVNDLKSTIRSIRRLLERKEDLPAGVRIEKERHLQTLQHELDKQQKAKDRSAIVGKWHKVRFFERRKAERRLKKAKKELSKAEENGLVVRDMVKRVEECELNVAYATYFPLEQDYVPLFAKGAEGKTDSAEENEEDEPGKLGDQQMRQQIKSCMRDGTLQQLRDGKLQDNQDGGTGTAKAGSAAKAEASKTRKPGANKANGEHLKGRMAKEAEESDDDGMGFFE